MNGDANEEAGRSLSLPVGVLATAVLVGGAAAIAYMFVSRQEEAESGSAGRHRSAGGGLFRRVGLMTLVTLIENDATRKVVVSVLKAIARRS